MMKGKGKSEGKETREGKKEEEGSVEEVWKMGRKMRTSKRGKGKE